MVFVKLFMLARVFLSLLVVLSPETPLVLGNDQKCSIIAIMSNLFSPIYFFSSFTRQCLFKNTKSNSFNLESTHTTYPDKLEKLMVVIAVATAISIRTSQWQEKIKPTIYKKTVNTPLYSTVRRGFDALRR